MLCEETKPLFSMYVDDVLSLPARAAVDAHLRQCPVCRAHLADLRAIRHSLSALSRPVIPADLTNSITEALAIEAEARRLQPSLTFGIRFARWLEPKLMPYTVGSFASVILFVAMFAALRPHFVALREAASHQAAVYRVTAVTGYNIYEPVTPQGYAASRAPFAEQSPSLNPAGALAALTRSYTHPHHAEPFEAADDMIVVADVFSNGSASLASVVQAPRDRRMLADFESALRQDAAFVPASFDRRPDTMRVVFTVQKVDVRERNF
jgi:Putative zinc-finger